jgi:Protein of unknown function (DUF3303)
MLFIVISTPRPEKPSSMKSARLRFWKWMDPLLAAKRAHWVYARTGRGAVALFDVADNETLHRLINEWAEIIPAQFEICPVLDAAAAKKHLRRRRSHSGHRAR